MKFFGPARTALVSCALAAALFPAPAAGSTPPPPPGEGNWPQWRGPASLGISTERGLPDEWAADRNVKWKTPVPGKGHSSPIVWGKRVFLTTAVEGAPVPGAKAATHTIEGKELRHPDSV